MTDHWKTIIQSRYVNGEIDKAKVRSLVPLLITQSECNQIFKSKR